MQIIFRDLSPRYTAPLFLRKISRLLGEDTVDDLGAESVELWFLK